MIWGVVPPPVTKGVNGRVSKVKCQAAGCAAWRPERSLFGQAGGTMLKGDLHFTVNPFSIATSVIVADWW